MVWQPKRGVRIKVSSKEDRTYDGIVYASKMESDYARNLDLAQRAGKVIRWHRQIIVYLGNTLEPYRIDFEVFEPIKVKLIDGTEKIFERVYAVDVKGQETDTFKKHKKLWTQFGRMPLLIVKRKGIVETIQPGMMNNLIRQ